MRALRHVRSGPAAVWRTLLEAWFLLSPAWPVLLANLVATLVLLAVGQGREALYAATDFDDTRTYWTFLGLFGFGATSFLTVLLTTSQYYAEISVRTWRSASARFFAAVCVGLFTPLMVLFGFLTSLYQLAKPQTLSDLTAADLGQQVHDTICAAMACALILALLGGLCLWLDPRNRTLKSPFSEIVVVRQPTRWVLRVIVALGVVGAIAMVAFPATSVFVGTLFVFFVGLSLWALLGAYGEMVLAKLRWPPLTILASGIVMACLFLASVEGLLAARSHNALVVVGRSVSSERLPVNLYAERWLTQYLKAYPNRPAEPIVVILSEGGGIRAALHTSMVLSALDAQSCGAFYQHVYAISAVSGGSVGVAAFMSKRAEFARVQSSGCDGRARPRIYQQLAGEERTQLAAYLTQDHFAPLMAGLLLKDAPFGFLPTTASDRSRTFEDAFSGSYALDGVLSTGESDMETIHRGMRADFESAVAQAFPGRQPVILLNTVRTNDGGLDVVSNVSFPGGGSYRAFNLLDRLNCPGSAKFSLSLSTSALLSARFPIVTPPAVLDTPSCASRKAPPSQRIRYVDGGYLDNSGATSATDAVNALLEACKTKFANRCPEIRVLHIFARGKTTQTGDLPSTDDTLPEITGPAAAWFNGRQVSTRIPLENLCRLINSHASDQADATCSIMMSTRTLRSAQGDEVVASRLPVSFISAGLDVGKFGADDYVPLGWVLGKSKTHIFNTTRLERQTRICELFQSEMPSEPWNCARLPAP